MHFNTVPAIGPRYWVAIAVASVAGANLGDVLPDALGIDSARGLPWLAVAFLAVASVGRVARSEAPYWVAILIVRAAATNLADLATHHAGWSYAAFSAGLAVLLAAIVAGIRIVRPDASIDNVSRSDGVFWLAMLTAGTLGTAGGDGLARILHPVTIGYPAATVFTTLVLAAVLGWRLRAARLSVAGYWITVVAIRTWGTNAGDVSGYVLTIPGSLALSVLVLTVLLVAWREPLRPVGYAAA